MANSGTQQMPLYPRTGNYGLASLLNQALAQPADYRPWPGFRHPCRNDGFSGLPGLVYNGESWSLGTSQTSYFHGNPSVNWTGPFGAIGVSRITPIVNLDIAVSPITYAFTLRRCAVA